MFAKYAKYYLAKYDNLSSEVKMTHTYNFFFFSYDFSKIINFETDWGGESQCKFEQFIHKAFVYTEEFLYLHLLKF